VTDVRIQPLTIDDLPAINALEADAYEPALHESDASFRRLIELFPEGALGAFDANGLCGYAIGVPLRAGDTLTLREPLARIPDQPDTFYIHDLAIAARCRGRGLGRVLAERLIAVGRHRGFRRFELVSVQGSHVFWARFGFDPAEQFEYAPGAPSMKMVRSEDS
jgi:ribosomal protein S18 acetylase RimI-like enzyme